MDLNNLNIEDLKEVRFFVVAVPTPIDGSNLPNLKPTNITDIKQSTKVPGNWFNKGGKDRQKNRSKFFDGFARAMANQWS